MKLLAFNQQSDRRPAKHPSIIKGSGSHRKAKAPEDKKSSMKVAKTRVNQETQHISVCFV